MAVVPILSVDLVESVDLVVNCGPAHKNIGSGWEVRIYLFIKYELMYEAAHISFLIANTSATPY